MNPCPFGSSLYAKGSGQDLGKLCHGEGDRSTELEVSGCSGYVGGGQPLSEVFPHKVQHPCSHMCAYQAEDASPWSPVRPTSALGGISWVISSQTMNQAVRHGLQPCAKGSATSVSCEANAPYRQPGSSLPGVQAGAEEEPQPGMTKSWARKHGGHPVGNIPSCCRRCSAARGWHAFRRGAVHPTPNLRQAHGLLQQPARTNHHQLCFT